MSGTDAVQQWRAFRDPRTGDLVVTNGKVRKVISWLIIRKANFYRHSQWGELVKMSEEDTAIVLIERWAARGLV